MISIYFQQYHEILFSENTVNLQNRIIHDRKCVRKLSSGEDKGIVIDQRNETSDTSGDSLVLASVRNAESSLTESLTDGSEKEASGSDSNIDADSEASESENASQHARLFRSSSRYFVHANGHLHHSLASELQPQETDSGDESLAKSMSELHLSNTVTGQSNFDKENQLLNVPNNLCFLEKHVVASRPPNAFQTLSQSYITTSKECSVQSCLYQFTSMELLMGNNKLLCENCTEKKQKHQNENSSPGKY